MVDIKNAKLRGKISQPSANHDFFQRVRSAPRNKSDVRFVIDLKRPIHADSFLLPPDGQYGHRLVVDILDKDAPILDAGLAKKPAVLAKPKQKVASAKAKVKSARNKPAKGKPRSTNKQVVVKSTRTTNPTIAVREAKPKPIIKASARRTKLREVVIAIDAGHGGNDPGARGPRGTREKEVVLAIAKRLDALIRKEPGMRSVMIRTGDYYVGLRQRIKKARKAKADLFVSIHADAFKKSTVKGSSVFTLSRRGASSEAARWLAAHENAVDLVGGVSLDDKDDMLASVLLDLSQTATKEASSNVAAKVLRNLKSMGAVHKKTVQSAGFVVLKSPDIPSILVETAFISNPDEEKKLRSSKYQDRLAKAVFSGLQDYFAIYAPPGTHIAARRHIIERGETLSGIANQYGVSTRQLQLTNALSSSQIQVGQVLEIPEGS